MKKWIGSVTVVLLTGFASSSFGATGAQLISDLNPGSAGSFPSNLTVYANSLIFNAYTLETGRELWKYDGTNVTLVADINDTKDDLGGGVFEGNDSLPAWLTPFNGSLFFSAYEPRRGDELWKYDGSTVQRVTDINPDLNDTIKISPNSSWPSELTVFKGALYFSADNNTARTNYELWKYDGATSTLVTNIHPDLGTNYSSYPNNLFAWNNGVYFMADDGSHGFELWKHDGTKTALFDINPGDENSGSYPKNFTPFQNSLMFVAARGDVGYELWKTDGTNVVLAADINAGAGSSYPDFLMEFNGTLYFQAADATSGSELWKYDGTTASLAADINPSGDSFPKNLTVFGSQLCFAADDGVHGWELWRFDGSKAEIVADLNPEGDSFPENLIVLNNVLYFTATTPDTGYELFKYDGTNVTLAADINPGAGDSYPQFLTVYNGKLFLRAADDGTSNWELWSYTPESIQQTPAVTLLTPADGSTYLTTDTITFSANASGGSAIAKIEFFSDGILIGTDSTTPYSVSSSLSAGSHSITAKATDVNGASATSNPASVTVNLAVQNAPPSITLSSPQAGQVLVSPANISLLASATDDGGVAQVEFFQDGNSIGVDTTSPFDSTVSNLAPGVYSFAAVAKDNLGLTTTSSSIQVRVTTATSISSITQNGEAFTISASATKGLTYDLESTTDFSKWTAAGTVTATGDTITFNVSSSAPSQYYRVTIH